MDDETFIVKCAKHNSFFYFLKKEIFSLIYFILFILLLIVCSMILEIYSMFIIIGGIKIFFYSLYGLIPAYKRAKYIKECRCYGINNQIIIFYAANGDVIKKVNVSSEDFNLIDNGKYQDIIFGGKISNIISSLGDSECLVQLELCKLTNGNETFDCLMSNKNK